MRHRKPQESMEVEECCFENGLDIIFESEEELDLFLAHGATANTDRPFCFGGEHGDCDQCTHWDQCMRAQKGNDDE